MQQEPQQPTPARSLPTQPRMEIAQPFGFFDSEPAPLRRSRSHLSPGDFGTFSGFLLPQAELLTAVVFTNFLCIAWHGCLSIWTELKGEEGPKGGLTKLNCGAGMPVP